MSYETVMVLMYAVVCGSIGIMFIIDAWMDR